MNALSSAASEGLRAVIYTRVSKDDGDTEGASSTERQEQDCSALAATYRWNVVAVERDQGISASGNAERPAWERVLRLVEAGEVDLIVAWHLDRMTRNMTDLERLILLAEHHSVGIKTYTGDMDLTTDTGRMVARILAAVARAEVERKAARQKRANLARREAGIPWKSGFRAFGYTLKGEVVGEEAKLIREGAEAFLAGEALKSIARTWEASGVKPPRAKVWHQTSVRAILLNARIAGYMTYDREITGIGAWEPIVDPDTWGLISARLNDPARKVGGSSRGRKAENLLTSLATCARCDEMVKGKTTRLRERKGAKGTLGYTGATVPIYSCEHRHLTTVRSEADGWVVDAMSLAASVHAPGLVLSIPEPGQSLELVAVVEEKREQMRELGKAFATLPRIAFDAAMEALSADLEAAEAAASAASVGDVDPSRLNAEAVTNFRDADLDTQRAVLARVARIRLHPRGRGKRNLHISEQVEMDVKVTEADGSSEWVPVLRPRATGWEPAKASKPSHLLPITARAMAEAKGL
ncbi:hypothetical protein NODU109028_11580 [Nocardioides dubius]|uniref:recombinase family protein n=3 Tax=Nocardioides dubius TaxID=317019 RepID=UPI0039EC84D1